MAKNTGKWAAGALVAGLVGYAAGVLTAPKSGKETREDIKNAANKARLEAERRLKELNADLSDALDQAKVKAKTLKGKALEELNKATAKATDAKNKVREMISAIHEGDAEDPELKKALSDAKNALKNLETYLKK